MCDYCGCRQQPAIAELPDEEVDLFPYAMYELTPAQWDAVAEVHTSSAPVPS